MPAKGPKPKKSLGQHWLHDTDILQAIVDEADIEPNNVVLEIGPGLGTLTQVLLNKSAFVTAVEFDTELAKTLEGRVHIGNGELVVHESDILQFDLTKLPTGYKVVANIPYYLTSQLVRVLGQSANPPQKAILLVQKEVAERVCAGAGDASVLSVATQVFFEPTLGTTVPPEAFTPPPKVHSQVLILTRRQHPLIASADQKEFFRLVKAGFSERRKKLRSSLSGGLQISKEQADALLAQAAIDANLRAQNLAITDWQKLLKAYTDKH